jgi:hypothetical protein
VKKNEGQWTYTGGRGESIIDYVIGNAEAKEWIEKMEVRDNVESDQHPATVEIKPARKEGGKEEGGKGE